MNQTPTLTAQRRRLLLIPLGVVCAAAFITGAVLASGSPEKDSVARFAAAWVDGDYTAMYAELNSKAKGQYLLEDMQAAYDAAATKSTETSVAVSDVRGPLSQDGTDVVALPTTVQTTAFGAVSGEIAVPVADGGISWRPNLVFPGLGEGDTLKSQIKLGKRAPILAADRSPLAQGPASSRTTTGSGFLGETGVPTGKEDGQIDTSGLPKGAATGLNGLELAFNSTLAGTPGGKLLAVAAGGSKTVLAKHAAVPGEPVRTTIDPDLQNATAAALGNTFGGAAVLDAKNGNILALAGLAFSAPQPPGSTFKVITASAALENGDTKLSEEFPVETGAVVDGRTVSNAYDEACGGSLVTSFAKSCNSVFAPLGVRVGGPKLVDMAELYGFNAPPSLYNSASLTLTQPPESTIPQQLGSDLDVAVSAIGQGEVLATPLEMASASQTIGAGGVRAPTSIVKDPTLAGDYQPTTVIKPDVADEMKQLMIAVVSSGTGIAGAVPGVTVAGKTGTAELGVPSGEPTTPGSDPQQQVDAWFTAFAPADNPKLAVAVMVVNATGDGGTIAAPIARQILEAGL